MITSIIAAAGENNEIGKANGLLWHLPNDMKRFREITTGHTVVMGRKTFDSLPKGALPNRTNIVVSRNKNLVLENCIVLNSLDEALVRLRNEAEIFIIGGAAIYRQVFPLADKIYLTRVQAKFPDADVSFPKLNPEEWQILSRETFPPDEKNVYFCTFYEYKRIFP